MRWWCRCFLILQWVKEQDWMWSSLKFHMKHVVGKRGKGDVTLAFSQRFDFCLFWKRVILSHQLMINLFLRWGHGGVIWALLCRQCWRWRARIDWWRCITFSFTFLCWGWNWAVIVHPFGQVFDKDHQKTFWVDHDRDITKACFTLQDKFLLWINNSYKCKPR